MGYVGEGGGGGETAGGLLLPLVFHPGVCNFSLPWTPGSSPETQEFEQEGL